MNRFKTAALFAASVTGLALSAATFAAESTEYKDAVSAAKSDYKSAVAVCKDLKSAERNNCMKDAKAEEKLALNKAKDMHGEAKATGTVGKESGHKPMMQDAGKPMMQDAGKPIDTSAPQAKPADPVTK